MESPNPPPDRSFAELLDKPEVDEELELRSKFGFAAYHGGNLERRTEIIAAEAAERAGASYYGVVQPPGMRRHIPSIKIDPKVSRRFASFVDHCQVVVTIHGYGREGMYTSLLCGGANRTLATHVAGHLRSALPTYEIIDDLERIPKELRGLHRKNPCNLTAGGGMQLELPPRVRGLTPKFTRIDDGLIEGLADAARSWGHSD